MARSLLALLLIPSLALGAPGATPSQPQRDKSGACAECGLGPESQPTEEPVACVAKPGTPAEEESDMIEGFLAIAKVCGQHTWDGGKWLTDQIWASGKCITIDLPAQGLTDLVRLIRGRRPPTRAHQSPAASPAAASPQQRKQDTSCIPKLAAVREVLLRHKIETWDLMRKAAGDYWHCTPLREKVLTFCSLLGVGGAVAGGVKVGTKLRALITRNAALATEKSALETELAALKLLREMEEARKAARIAERIALTPEVKIGRLADEAESALSGGQGRYAWLEKVDDGEEIARELFVDPKTFTLDARNTAHAPYQLLSKLARTDEGALIRFDYDYLKILNDNVIDGPALRTAFPRLAGKALPKLDRPDGKGLGELVGDLYLRLVADEIKLGIRQGGDVGKAGSDLLFRLGGDEFEVLILNVGSRKVEQIEADLARRVGESPKIRELFTALSADAMERASATSAPSVREEAKRFLNWLQVVEKGSVTTAGTRLSRTADVEGSVRSALDGAIKVKKTKTYEALQERAKGLGIDPAQFQRRSH